MTTLFVLVFTVSLLTLLIVRVRRAAAEYDAAQVRLRRASASSRTETQMRWIYK